MASDWILHVKKVAAKKKISYKEAMKVAAATYKKKGKGKGKKEEDLLDEKKGKGKKSKK